MILNSQMASVLRRVGTEHRPELSPGLNNILQSGLVENKGCLCLAAVSNSLDHVDVSDFGDLTGMECFANKIDIGRTVGSKLGLQDPILQGIQYTYELCKLLREFDTSERFELILSCTEMPDLAHVVCTFHRIREEEQWLLDDLETYQSEALLCIRTGAGDWSALEELAAI